MKKNSEFRIFIAILALIVSLGILFGGFTLYNRYLIINPLATGLKKIDCITEVTIKKDKLYEIEIQLEKVNDIQAVYKSIVETIDKRLDDDDYTLTIIDKPNDKIVNLNKNIQSAVYEALANNEFTWLKEILLNMASKSDVHCELFVDNKNVYIQITDNESYMYKIIERPTQNQDI